MAASWPVLRCAVYQTAVSINFLDPSELVLPACLSCSVDVAGVLQVTLPMSLYHPYGEGCGDDNTGGEPMQVPRRASLVLCCG